MGAGIPSLTLQEALQISGWFLGTMLHVVLFVLFLRRARRRPGERLFAGLVCAVGLWNLGQFVEAFATVLLRGHVPPSLLIATDLTAYLGLLLIPSTVLHSLLALVIEPGGPAESRLRLLRLPGLIAIYSPLVYIGRVVELTRREPGAPGFVQLGELTTLYFGWFLLALLISAGLSLILARRAQRPRERTFFIAMIASLIGTGVLLVTIALARLESLEKAGLTVEALVILTSTMPSAMFGYYVHRYDDVEFILRRSLFYIVLIGATILTYLWVISVVSALLERRFGLHRGLVEAALVLGLIVLFHPFRRLLHRAFNVFFFRQTYQYQKVFSELVSFMGQGSARRVRTLVEHVSSSISKALDLVDSEIVLIAPSGAATRLSDRGRDPAAVAACVELFETRGWEYFRLSDLGSRGLDGRALAEAVELAAEAIFAVRHERRVVGLLVVGSKHDGRPLFAEEINLLLALSEHLAISLENLKLYEEKAALEHKLRETERRLALGRFSSSVAHRVKNPLSSIKAITQAIALDMPDRDERRADLFVVVDEIDRLNAVVDQLLDFAEADADSSDPVPVRPGVLLEEVIELFRHEATPHGVTIRIAVEDSGADDELRVLAVPADLREILSNLIQNGIHAMEERGGELLVEVSHGSGAAQGGASDTVDATPMGVTIRVLDEGAGLPPDGAERIFEPFFTTKPRGTGLGLAITRRKVEELGGRITAEPRPEGRGSCLTLEFPSATTNEVELGGERAPSDACPSDGAEATAKAAGASSSEEPAASADDAAEDVASGTESRPGEPLQGRVSA